MCLLQNVSLYYSKGRVVLVSATLSLNVTISFLHCNAHTAGEMSTVLCEVAVHFDAMNRAISIAVGSKL